MKSTLRSGKMLAACFTVLVATAFDGPQANSEDLPPGEMPFASVKSERPSAITLLSGKRFRSNSLGWDAIAETSGDEGKTWEQGGRINPNGIPGHACYAMRNSAIQLQAGPHKGRIIFPYKISFAGDHPDYSSKDRGGYVTWKGEVICLETHTHYPEMDITYFCYSDDEGKTWSTSAGELMGYFNEGLDGVITCDEPSIAELKDGRILCFMRSTCGRIVKSYSSDGGVHWSKVEPTELAMSNSPCAMKRIPTTGDLVLVWNQMSNAEIEHGYRRGRLTMALSKDDGQTWENFKTLELSPGLEDVKRVKLSPVKSMVRGPSGRDSLMGDIPDGFTHYHYPYLAITKDHFFVSYGLTPLGGGSSTTERAFSITGLYGE